MSRYCCVALPRGAMDLSAFFVIVAFPDHIHLQTEKATQAEKNPYSVFAEKDGEEVMDDESVVFTEPSSSDHLPKGTLSRLPLT